MGMIADDELRRDAAKRLHALGQRLVRSPTDAVLHNEIGVALAASERIHEALVSFERATQHCPGLAEGWFNRGLVLGILGRQDEAFDALHRACDLAPNYEAARGRLEGIGAQLGRRPKRDPWLPAGGWTGLISRVVASGEVAALPEWNSDAAQVE